MKHLFAALTAFTLAICTSASMAQACEGRLLDNDRVYAAPLCIPAEPKRIVVLDHGLSLGVGMDLDLPIVGAPLAYLSDTEFANAARAAEIVDIGIPGNPSLETVVALQPDLMIAASTDIGLIESLHPLLSSMAPTLVYTSGDWRGYYELLSTLNGTEAKIAKEFADFDARLADIRSRVPDTEVSIVRITSWDFQVTPDAPNAYAPFAIAAQAGVKRTDWETESEGSKDKRPDWEELAELDGDVLLYIVGGTNSSDTDGRYEEVTSSPLWQMLPAVKAGRVHRIASSVWIEFRGLHSAHRVLDDIEKYVIAQ